MRSARRAFSALALAVAILATAVVAGCGGSDGDSPSAQASPAVIARANANCRQLRRDLVGIGRTAFAGSTNLAEATTERIIKPSIPLLETLARRQQSLAAGSGDPELELYARLFEPITVLAHERLQSGEESNSPLNVAARGFEILTSTVADEQRQVAKEAGIADCAIDFEQVLTSALRGS